MDYYADYSLEQLVALQKEIDSAIKEKKKVAQRKAKEELAILLEQVNQLQQKYDITISAYDENVYDNTFVSDLRVADFN